MKDDSELTSTPISGYDSLLGNIICLRSLKRKVKMQGQDEDEKYKFEEKILALLKAKSILEKLGLEETRPKEKFRIRKNKRI